MRLEQVRRDVTTSGVMQVARATIKATPKIFSFFENSTYANKPLAICRELVANGIDSHIAAGCPHRAVEVTLPIELDPVFKVRDFGIGMSHMFLVGDENTPSQFMAYTDGSTKDDSNDQIGGFGIGSKSPFAYCDQFTIRSVHDGHLGVYTVFKGEDGVPLIGCLGRTETREPNGVEVSFPVEVDDIATFHEAAQQALQYFKPLPVVINGTVSAPIFAYEGSDWAIRNEAGPIGVIMGGVRYPVSTANLDWSLRSNGKLSPLLEYGIDLWMPIGACGVALSREQLSYDGNTSKNIQDKLEGLVDEITATFSTMFDDQPSLWEAMKALHKEVGSNSYGTNARQNLLRNNAMYRGVKLTTSMSFRANQIGGSLWIIESENSRRAATSLKTMKWDSTLDSGYVEPGTVGHVIIDNLPDSPKSKVGAKIREYLETNGRAQLTLVFRVAYHDRTDRTAINMLLAKLGDPANVVYTADMPEPTRVERTKNAERPRVRMFTFTGEGDRFTQSRIGNLTPGYSKDGIVVEVPYAAQPDTGILVVMNSFDLPGNFYQMMAAGLINYDELHFVNAGDAPKLNWPRFEDVFQQRLEAELNKYPELAQRLAVSRDSLLSKRWPVVRHLDYDRLTPAQQRRPLGRLTALYRDYVVPLTNEQLRLAPFVTAALPARLDPEALNKSISADVKILINVLDLSNAAHLALLLKNI